MFSKIKVKYLSALFSFLCFSAFAQLSPRDAAYYQSAGAFKNPEFVERGDGWELTGCVSIPASYSTATFPYANRSLNITCLAETLTVKQCTDKFDNLQAYVNAYGSVTIGSSLGNDVYWRVTDGTNTLYEEKVPDDGKLHLINAPLLFAQDNLCIEIASDGDITGSVALSQNNIEVNKNTSLIGVFADSTGWENKGPITITSTGGSITKGSTLEDKVSCQRNGPNMILKMDYAQDGAGSMPSGDMLISIPDECAGSTGLEIDTEVAPVYNLGNGYPSVNVIRGSLGQVAARLEGNRVLFGSAIVYDNTSFRIYGNVLQNDSNTSTTGWVSTSTGANILSTGNGSFTALLTIPIKQWRLGTTGIAQRRNFDNLDNHAFYGATVDGATYAVTRESVDWINGACTFATGYTCNFNKTFSSPPQCIAITRDAPGIITEILETTTNVNIQFAVRTDEGSSNFKPPSFNLMCFTNSEDYQKAFADYIAGLLRQSSIVQDVEQFPTTEQKLCDACYKGKALYKKCHEGSIDNAHVFGTGVTDFANSTGWFQQSSTRRSSIPYNNGITWTYLELDPVSKNLKVNKNATGQVSICAEYTKD